MTFCPILPINDDGNNDDRIYVSKVADKPVASNCACHACKDKGSLINCANPNHTQYIHQECCENGIYSLGKG